MWFVVVVLALALGACGETQSAVTTAARPGLEPERPRGVVEDCSSRSEADFPGAYLSGGDNVVVGPLALVGAAYTETETIREFGDDKLFALLRPGHRVTLALPPGRRRVAALGYGPLPELVELKPRDGIRAVTFVSCPPGERSGSTADGEPVTLWVGFILASRPQCLPISVWVDDDPTPRRALLRLGVERCP
jgi:hypothetical protein